MPSDRPENALRDVLRHIDLAGSFAAGLDRAAFVADARTVYAVVRCLEIISEASRKLPERALPPLRVVVEQELAREA
jgi:uncharacterized protein with HEPN domain